MLAGIVVHGDRLPDMLVQLLAVHPTGPLQEAVFDAAGRAADAPDLGRDRTTVVTSGQKKRHSVFRFSPRYVLPVYDADRHTKSHLYLTNYLHFYFKYDTI